MDVVQDQAEWEPEGWGLRVARKCGSREMAPCGGVVEARPRVSFGHKDLVS